MPFVIDASIVAAWAFGEHAPAAAEAKARLADEAGAAPGLWWYELRNVLLVAERRGRLPEDGAAAFLRDIADLDVTLDHSPDEAAVMDLARRHRLTVHDAAYLELAVRERAPIATLDAALASAAQAEGVELVGGAAA